MKIIFNVPDEKVSTIVEAINGLYPNPDSHNITPGKWAKEKIRRWVIETVQRYKHRQTINAIVIPQDDTLITLDEEP